MNSTELLARYRDEGSEKAFAELVQRYQNLVFSVAKRQLGSEALAADATQEVFLRLARNKTPLSSEHAVLGWLHRTALHVSIDLVRSESRRRLREEKSVETEVKDDESMWEELVPVLDGALDKLKEEERSVLLLRFFDRKPFAELGATLQISENAAKMRVSRAVDKLRELLLAQKVSCTAAALSALLLTRAVQAAPQGLAARLLTLRPLSHGTATRLPFTPPQMFVGTALVLLVGTLIVSRWMSPMAKHPKPVAQMDSILPTPSHSVPPSFPKNSAVASGVSGSAHMNARSVLLFSDADTGLPISGVRVNTVYFYAGGVGEGEETSSTSDGRAAIPFPRNEGEHGANIFVTAEGYVPKSLGWRESFPPMYEMQLEPALTFAGHVVDEQGQPVPDVVVTMECPSIEIYPQKAENISYGTTGPASVTDAFGAFRFPYVPREVPASRYGRTEVQLILTANGFEVTRTNFAAPLAARHDLRLIVQRGIVIAGQVVDLEGNPVANASVREVHNLGTRKLRTHTDAFGRFELIGVSRPPYKNVTMIVVQPLGWASQTRRVALNTQTNWVNFTLTKSPIFRGRVIDENGLPLAEVTVRTDIADSLLGLEYDWSDVTGSNGRFEWTSAPNEQTLFWFEKAGYQPIRKMPLNPNGTDYEITLQRSGSTRVVTQPVRTPKYSFRFYEPPPAGE